MMLLCACGTGFGAAQRVLVTTKRASRYGSARNLTGMRPVWLVLSLTSCAGSWAAHIWGSSGLWWPGVGVDCPRANVPDRVLPVLPSYVRTRARYYCEIFFQLLEEEATRDGDLATS